MHSKVEPDKLYTRWTNQGWLLTDVSDVPEKNHLYCYIDRKKGKQAYWIWAWPMNVMIATYEYTGDQKYLQTSERLEQFLRKNVEDRYWFTGQHPDLYPEDFESDSIWSVCEYWLDKYDRTRDAECLKRAEANAWFAFLMLCPKQLSWVRNPTHTCHTEQLHCQQYSNYAYHNKKLAMMNVADIILFILDPSEHCGYPMEVQLNLLEQK